MCCNMLYLAIEKRCRPMSLVLYHAVDQHMWIFNLLRLARDMNCVSKKKKNRKERN